jgi:hypothetical protein
MASTKLKLGRCPTNPATVGSKRAEIFDTRRQNIYLTALAKAGRKIRAAEAAGVSMNAVADARGRVEGFREAEELAVEIHVEWMEEQVDIMAFHGIEEPVFQGGELVGHKLRFSERLAELRLKAEAPQKYRDNFKLEVEHKGGVLVAPARLSPVEWAQQEADRLRAHRQENSIEVKPS